jgi:hypothetical protein
MSLVIQSDRHTAALERLLSTSKRTAAEVLRQEAKLIFTLVAKVTPPSHSGVTGRKAETHAKAKIAGEIYSLYGKPSDAYDAIAPKSAAAASAFWFLHQRGEDAAANSLLREATGSILYPFDGGKHHRQNFRKSARRKKGFMFFVTNPQSLHSYVQQQQSHVWYLASGWREALSSLGAKAPYGVGRHSAPGTLRVETTGGRLAITMTNRVSYARSVKDLERRIRWAMDVRTDRMQRNWDHYLSRIAGEAGMTRK